MPNRSTNSKGRVFGQLRLLTYLPQFNMIHIDALKKLVQNPKNIRQIARVFSSLLKNVPERIFKSQIVSSENSQ